MLFTANYLIVATYLCFIHCHAWECFNDNCYLRGNDKVGFKVAEAYCKNIGAELTSINSQLENDFLQKFCFSTYCWIGFTDEAVEREWKWLDGSPVTFTGWHPKKPSNANGADYAMRGRDWWHDVQEKTLVRPLCKKKGPIAPTNQPTDVLTPTGCTAWTQEVASNNCPPEIISKTFGIKACNKSYQQKLEVSLANMLYGTCNSVCVYNYDDLESAFFFKKGCYKYVTKGKCFNKKKFGEAMRQILERQLKNVGC